jgi:hypothetical protein
MYIKDNSLIITRMAMDAKDLVIQAHITDSSRMVLFGEKEYSKRTAKYTKLNGKMTISLAKLKFESSLTPTE